MELPIMPQNIQALSESHVVVDLETGTILGTNCVIVSYDDMHKFQAETGSPDMSDSDCIEQAKKYGQALYADTHRFY